MSTKTALHRRALVNGLTVKRDVPEGNEGWVTTGYNRGKKYYMDDVWTAMEMNDLARAAESLKEMESLEDSHSEIVAAINAGDWEAANAAAESSQFEEFMPEAFWNWINRCAEFESASEEE